MANSARILNENLSVTRPRTVQLRYS